MWMQPHNREQNHRDQAVDKKVLQTQIMIDRNWRQYLHKTSSSFKEIFVMIKLIMISWFLYQQAQALKVF